MCNEGCGDRTNKAKIKHIKLNSSIWIARIGMYMLNNENKKCLGCFERRCESFLFSYNLYIYFIYYIYLSFLL